MATLKSTYYSRKEAAGNQYSSGIDVGGKKRVAFFDFVTTGGAQNDTVDLVDLPKGARLLGGRLVGEALGTSVTLSLGTDVALTTPAGGSIAAGAANLLAATSYASAADNDFAKTFALGAGSTFNASGKVYATIGGATPTTAKYVCGWVEYVQN